MRLMKLRKHVEGEKESIQIVISVRNLVEFLLQSGDIDDRKGGRMYSEAMQEGGRIHRKLQKMEDSRYHAEYALKRVLSCGEYDVVLEGRADGIVFDDDRLEAYEEGVGEAGDIFVDEIKGMYLDVRHMEEPVEVHLAQAKCYAYLFAEAHGLQEIGVRMTYCNLDTEEIKRFSTSHSFEELRTWFEELMGRYRRWSDYLYQQKMRRQRSLQELRFPYEYRPGQKQIVSDVYRSITRGKTLFLQAPTGTGKTLAVIYPAIQAMGRGYGDRIFYLTAKNAAAVVARDAFCLLEQQGYQGKTVVITAKDKMCLLQERTCNPQDCPYAKGHFDRVGDAVYELLQQQNILDRETIREAAKHFMVCPFEFCLDLASWVDHIICDYNYVFDPNVALKRFFAEGRKENHIFLVDEAHNMVDRAREMYSETLVKEDFLTMKKYLKPLGKQIERALERCNRRFLEWKRECDSLLLPEDADAFLFSLYSLSGVMDELLQTETELPHRDDVLTFYFTLRNFITLAERRDQHYRLYCDYRDNGDFCVHLFCVDPSLLLQERLDRASATVYFSATLLPIRYYKELLCHDEDVYAVYAPSVFTKEQRLLLVGRDVTSRYVRRNSQEYERFATYILRIVEKKKGNYMVFCPSYKMLEEISAVFLSRQEEEYDVLIQTSAMAEAQKEEFLEEFEKEREKSLVAFCVMGGVFSEGIDLARERLIGAVIVGVALPQIGNEREVMKQYFTETERDGFSFAYLYPGMNKVIQAAGRVIRTPEDRGVIALLDQRFCQWSYARTFPREWEDHQICDLNSVDEVLRDFWKKDGDPV